MAGNHGRAETDGVGKGNGAHHQISRIDDAIQVVVHEHRNAVSRSVEEYRRWSAALHGRRLRQTDGGLHLVDRNLELAFAPPADQVRDSDGGNNANDADHHHQLDQGQSMIVSHA